jgi:proline dehydrogenase
LVEWFIKMKFPIKGLVKKTIFSWFCGGENIDDCKPTIELLQKAGVGTILDYSVEGEDNDLSKDSTCTEIINTIKIAKGNPGIPFCVFKATGLIQPSILEKVGLKVALTSTEIEWFENFKGRFESICKTAFELDVRVFVDAEESWYQEAIDALTYEMMAKYNKEKAIVFNTIQLYRHDRLQHIIDQTTNTSYYLGYKLVRGAYLEKENRKALEGNYESPMQRGKGKTDMDYNQALQFCIERIDKISICAGTHNELSCITLTQLMEENHVLKNDPRVWFAQLMGMSDDISFNLASEGYNVCKYVPYGPIKSVLPYLSRRAEENSSIAGQMSRELSLLRAELKRRKLARG